MQHAWTKCIVWSLAGALTLALLTLPPLLHSQAQKEEPQLKFPLLGVKIITSDGIVELPGQKIKLAGQKIKSKVLLTGQLTGKNLRVTYPQIEKDAKQVGGIVEGEPAVLELRRDGKPFITIMSKRFVFSLSGEKLVFDLRPEATLEEKGNRVEEEG